MIKLLNDKPVGFKISLIVALLGTVLLGTTTLSILKLVQLDSQIETIRSESLTRGSLLYDVEKGLLQERIDVLSHASAVGKPAKDVFEQALEKSRIYTDERVSLYLRSAPDKKKDFAKIETKIKEYRNMISGEYIQASLNDDMVRVGELRDFKAKTQVGEINDMLNDLVKQEESNANKIVSDAEKEVNKTTIELIIAVLLCLSVALVLSTSITRQITQSLKIVNGTISALAQGDLTKRSKLSHKDQIGVMGTKLDTAIDHIHESLDTVTQSTFVLSSSAEQMAAASTQVDALTSGVADRAESVNEEVQQINDNVENLAAAAEQMVSSIREISGNASSAAQVAYDAVNEMEGVDAKIAHLKDASQEIGEVVDMIAAVAKQTNLLALNANIEAARAGEAGKGFSVVADEVKKLAHETAQATQSISGRIKAIQESTTDISGSLDKVSGIITNINDYQTTIAAAVEEQTATTNEMTRNVHNSANSISTITNTVNRLAEDSRTASQGVAETKQAAGSLADTSNTLHSVVMTFKLSS